MNIQIEHRKEQVKAVPIPGIKEEVLQKEIHEQPTEMNKEQDDMDLYFEQRPEDETNDFFADMVNTDDDPTVSEFINTD
ncbi:hypothetical protein G6F56_006165 [Rhizopus delemar]|nr:hypothetical protein G6F56_006165 [Rhizopus delemar]